MLDTTLSSSTSKSSVKDPKANVIKEEPEAEKKEETTNDVVANGAPEGKIFFFICSRKSNNSHMHDVGWTSTLITIGFGSFLFCFNLVLHTLNTLVSFI